MEEIIEGIFKVNGKYYFETVKKVFSDSKENVDDQIRNWHQKMSKYLIASDRKKVELFDGQLNLSYNSKYTVYLKINNILIYHRNVKGELTPCFMPEEACLNLNVHESKGIIFNEIIKNNLLLFNKEIKSIKQSIVQLNHVINSVRNVNDKSGINFLAANRSELFEKEKELKDWREVIDRQNILVQEYEVREEKKTAINFLNSI